MLNINTLLEKNNLKFEDLNSQERDTLQKWSEAWQKNQLSVEKIKEFIAGLVNAVQKELADVRESTSFFSWLFHRKKDIFLKARLRNYLTIQDFLIGPERAKKFIE